MAGTHYGGIRAWSAPQSFSGSRSRRSALAPNRRGHWFRIGLGYGLGLHSLDSAGIGPRDIMDRRAVAGADTGFRILFGTGTGPLLGSTARRLRSRARRLSFVRDDSAGARAVD